MVTDSMYWKSHLLRQSSLLKKCMVQKRWGDASFMKCELAIMVSFYAIRKLIEAKKLTDRVTREPVSVRYYSSTGKPVTRLNNHRLDELYDLDSSRTKAMSLNELCHQFVHSYVFSPVIDEDSRGLSGVLIASDYQRNKGLFEVEIKTVINIFDKVANDEVRASHSTFDTLIGDYRVRNS